jgi:hypothetical protein
MLSGAKALEWSRVNVSGGASPAARRDFAMAHVPTINSVVVFGGMSSGFFDDTWLFLLSSSSWSAVSTVARPQARKSMVFGLSDNTLFICSGEGAGRTFFNDVWALDFSTSPLNWVLVVPASGLDESSLPEKRYGAAGGVHDGVLFLSHGFSNIRYSSTWRMDLRTRVWTRPFAGTHPYNPTVPHARCLTGTTPISNTSFAMFGGCVSGGLSGGPCPSFDGWVFREGTWSETSRGPAPRIYSAMVTSASANVVLMHGGLFKTNQMLQIGAKDILCAK